MQPTLLDRCRALLAELGIARPGEVSDAIPLTGGVASDIAVVRVGNDRICAKFALPKLKVKADWFAPVRRNAAEYAWLKFAAGVAPESAVKLYGQSDKLHGFAMEFLEGEDAYLWKSRLLSEAQGTGEAEKVGHLLGQIHKASSSRAVETRPFHNWDDFQALRIEPYLLHTAEQHGDIAPSLEQISEQLYETRQVLVHGDVSPKNILFRKSGPVMLDAECATMGDASFDPAFCLNHLVLKAIHLPNSRLRYLADAISLWRAYALHITWESPAAVELRVCKLLPALMLGRVDGKSPVEYLTASEQETVRQIARRNVITPARNLDALIKGIGASLKELAT